jgi:hypothetical protein
LHGGVLLVEVVLLIVYRPPTERHP